jgi:hypothetical protein
MRHKEKELENLILCLAGVFAIMIARKYEKFLRDPGRSKMSPLSVVEN